MNESTLYRNLYYKLIEINNKLSQIEPILNSVKNDYNNILLIDDISVYENEITKNLEVVNDTAENLKNRDIPYVKQQM